LKQIGTSLLLAIAFWPVWVWYVARTLDRSDEPWGLVALATAIVYLTVGSCSSARADSQSINGTSRLIASCNLMGIGLIVAYIFSYHMVPDLVRALFFIFAICSLILVRFPNIPKAGLSGLLVLSLPLLPSFNFFLGYPLRVLVTTGTCAMLRSLGVHADGDGVMLLVNGEPTAIDAPCSGVNMLWAELYVISLLGCFYKLNVRQLGLIAFSGFGMVLFANILRASSLILFDQVALTAQFSGLSKQEPIFHVAAGLLVFTTVCAATLVLCMKLSFKRNESVALPSSAKRDASLQQTFSVLSAKAMRYAFVPLCIVATVIPLFAPATSSRVPSGASPVWPSQINGREIFAVDSLAAENEFARDFPGAMKRFTDGTNSYFTRYIRRETRQLHPSSDCFRGLGFSIQPKPISVEPDGTKWGTFEASKSETHYRILERIYDGSGLSCTDVSEWYWLALTGKTKGPWFAVTIAQPIAIGD